MYAHKIADLFTRIGYNKKPRALANLDAASANSLQDYIREQKPLSHKLFFL